MSTPGPKPETTLAETLAVFTEADRPCTPRTATEVAEAVDCTRRTSHRKLERLADRGDLDTKKVGARSRVWWRPAEVGGVSGSGGKDEGWGPEQFGEFVRAVEDYAIFTLDPDGVVDSWNRGAEQIKGYAEEEIVGEHVSTFYTEEDLEAGVPERNLEVAIEDGRCEDRGWRVRADGSTFWADVVITAIRDDDGSLRGFTKVTRDLTERKRAEDALRRERESLDRILEASPAGVAVISADEEVVRSNPRADEILGVSGDRIYGAEGTTVYDESGEPVPVDELPFARVFEDGEPIRDWIGQVEGPEGDRRWVSLSVAPIENDAGEVEDVVIAGEDVTRLKEQARQLERQRDELETELDDVFERVDDAFYALDEEWRFTYVNEGAEELLRREGAELLGGRIWQEFPAAADGPIWDNFHRAMETQEPVTFEMYSEVLDFWAELAVHPSETGLSVYMRDVTDRVEREAELEQYETIVETVDDGVYVLDDDSRFLTVNQAHAELTGYDREELVGSHASLVTEASHVEEVDREVEERVGTDDPVFTVESELVRPDGERVATESRVSLFDLPDGGTGRVGVVRDITERKDRERRLERYQTVFETVEDGIYVLGPDFHFVEVNDAYAELTGYDREELVGSHCSLAVGEDVSGDAADRVRELATGEGESATMVADVATSEGEQIPAESKFSALPFGDGYRGSVGVVRDLRDRMAYERELRRYETLIEESTDVNAIVGGDGTVEYVTPSVDYVLGYDPEDLVGENAFEYIHPEDREKAAEELAELDEEAGSRRTAEFRFRHADGSWVWLETRGRNLQDDATIDGLVVYTRDVTDRKEYERELEARARQQAAISELGQHALEYPDVDDLFEEACRLVAETLDTDYCKVLDLDRGAGELLLRQGAGWDEGIVGSATVAADDNSQAGYTLQTEEPVVVSDLDEETRFSGPDLLTDHDVTSGVSTIIGSPDDPWGILGTHDTGERTFDEEDVTFVRSVANVLMTAIDRKTYERELERYRGIIETVNDGVYTVDTEGRFTMVNEAYAEMTGYQPGDLLGEHVSLVVEEETVETAQDREEMLLSGEDDTGALEAELTTADGGTVPAEATFALLPGRDREFERVGVVRDVTERRERERALEESERRYRTLAENFPEGIVALFDEDLRYTAAGGELVEEFDVDTEEAVGSTIQDRYPAELVEEVEPHFRAALEGETDSFEVEYHGLHLRAYTLPVRDADDEVYAGMLVVQDVTDRVEREQRLEELVEELEESNERLEQFAYVASHDLQEPLRMVSNYLQLIERRYADALDEDGEEFIEFAVDGAERMREMINDLLVYSRVDTRAEPFEPTDTDEVVDSVLKSLELRIEESDAEVEVGSLPTISADRNQLEQVFQNLVSNAIKYRDEDPPRIEIDAERVGDAWEFGVADNGIGIDPAHADRIFDVFERLHTGEEYSGTGIGLALSEKIVERHGGDIQVESEPGEGSTFLFTLPAERDDDEAEDPEASAPGRDTDE